MRTVHGLGFSFVCAAMWTCSSAVTAMVAPRTTLTVRVYDTVRLPAALERRALAEAEIVLRSALVDVRWQHCTGPARSEACSVPPAPEGEIASPGEVTVQGQLPKNGLESTEFSLARRLLNQRA
jgi:hypothetical protein